MNQAYADKTETTFKNIHRLYAREIYGFILRRLGVAEDAEDLVAEIFLLLWQKWESLDTQADLRSWLYRAAHFKLLEARRREKSIMFKLNQAALRLVDGGSGINFRDTRAADPSIRLGEDEERSRFAGSLERLLRQFPAEIKTILSLRIEEEKSFADIAGELGINERTVKTRYYRTLKKITRAWEKSRK